MRHARADYNDITAVDARIPADEPVFLLRGQDRLAAETVRHYARLTREHGGDPEIADRADRWAEEMEQWPAKKTADLPAFPPLPSVVPQTPGQVSSGEPEGDDVLKRAIDETRS